MKQKFGLSILFSFFAMACFTIYGCQHKIDVQNQVTEPVPNPNPGGNIDSTANGVPCSPDTVYFQNDILPILISNCAMSGCHDEISKQDGVNLTNYSSIISTGDVRPFRPDNSDLYEVLVETDPRKRMPLNGSLNNALISKIKKWIEQGALNNSCTDCDTLGVMSFSANVVPILQANCVGCHSGGAPSGGVNLNSYNGVTVVASNGRLLGSINHAIGYSPMPKNTNKLSVCDITKIEKWINDGAKNN